MIRSKNGQYSHLGTSDSLTQNPRCPGGSSQHETRARFEFSHSGVLRETPLLSGSLKADKEVAEGQTDLPFQGGTHGSTGFKEGRQDMMVFICPVD